MDYLQLKYSVERLTECLKIIPKEDKKVVSSLISKYNKELKSIDFLNTNNNFFDHEEIKAMERHLKPFRCEVLKPFQEAIDNIEEQIYIHVGARKADDFLEQITDRVYKISEWKAEKINKKWWFLVEEIREKSHIYQRASNELERKQEVFYRLQSESQKLKNAIDKKEKMEKKLHSFDIDLELKNLIAHRKRNMDKIPENVHVTIRESINIEIRKQWLIFLNKTTNDTNP